MDKQTVRKTFKYKLTPTPAQERARAFVLRRCCELYNAALEERKGAWEKRRVSLTAVDQSAQLPAIKAARPEYGDIHSQVLQDVLTRLDRAFQLFFRRVRAAEKAGYPRFKPSTRYTSFTYKHSVMGRRWITAASSSPRSGGWPCAGRVRWKARPRPSR